MLLSAARQFALSISAVALAASAGAQAPRNLGFEVADTSGLPAGWGVQAAGYRVSLDSVAPLAGLRALRIEWSGGGSPPQNGSIFASAGEGFAPLAVGGHLRLSGYIRTEGVQVGHAGFWLRVGGLGGKSLAFDNMFKRGLRGTTPWTRYEVELPVDSAATLISFGALLTGDGTAWFDSLALEIVGGPRLVDMQSWKPEYRPPEMTTRLLNDAELALPPDTQPLRESLAYMSWVKANAHPIRSLVSADFSDLRFLAPLLARKRVVQLGESSHGVAEFSLAKVRLIKYLHESLGYDVIAFESSIYECNRAQRAIDSVTAERLMRSCIFGVWHVEEALPLFEYLKETQHTNRPLVLAGFDPQPSAGMMLYRRPALLRSLVGTIDPTYARQVFATDSTYIARHMSRDAGAGLAVFYDSLADFFGAHRAAIQAAHRDDPAVALVARQAARSMAAYVRLIAAQGFVLAVSSRDSAMATNLDFLLDELYPHKRIIVWAHNEHVRYGEKTVDGADTVRVARRPMGSYLATRRRAELYTIGLFMYRGAAMPNNRIPYPIAPMRPGTFEAILHAAPWRYAFVDFTNAGRTPGSEWIWKPITGLSSGLTPERFTPRDEYDGVLFVDEVHPPHYLYVMPGTGVPR